MANPYLAATLLLLIPALAGLATPPTFETTLPHPVAPGRAMICMTPTGAMLSGRILCHGARSGKYSCDCPSGTRAVLAPVCRRGQLSANALPDADRLRREALATDGDLTYARVRDRPLCVPGPDWREPVRHLEPLPSPGYTNSGDYPVLPPSPQ